MLMHVLESLRAAPLVVSKQASHKYQGLQKQKVGEIKKRTISAQMFLEKDQAKCPCLNGSN